MAANQRLLLAFEQRSVIEFLLAEKYKTWNLQKNMWYVWSSMFKPKNVYKWAKDRFAPELKKVHGVEMHWHSGKEKVLGTAVCKESDTKHFLRHQKTYHNWFSWKICK